jgi:pyridinium-3,5-bisthiocarboxylic acid mononucleotide nickel chelatase
MPVFMKKNRPGTMVHVLCPRDCMESVIKRILSETTSIGLRYYETQRRMLPRDHVHFDTSLGRVRAKRITEMDGSVRIVPEYDVCRQIARERDIPMRMVYDTIIRETTGHEIS